ncbi:MAG: hypothetical protein DLM54_06965 [Acidimicrobiales bacterium]|nr:MAG: hypothetical protein DLM54_06965 [Acidimicrobiales bacterium]
MHQIKTVEAHLTHWRVTHQEMLANVQDRTLPPQTYETVHLVGRLEWITLAVQIMVVSEGPKGLSHP